MAEPARKNDAVPKALIVDDEKPIRDAIRMILKYESIGAAEAADAKSALRVLEDDGDIGVVLCDVKMPGMDGLELLEAIKSKRPTLPVIMMSGHGTIETAVEATRKGAFDFIEKPLGRERLLVTLRNAAGNESLRRANENLREALLGRYQITGSSSAISALKETIKRVAPTEARVLVTGENGTGKELVARNLHILSNRHEKPFVDINCAAIPKELIESELFGHEKGAFTGADKQKIGSFEQANGGTIFLDEIGDMDLAAQAKVLRVLEEGRVQRVGGTATIPIDVRVLAATNKDLEKEVAAGSFRDDLYYRLNVIPIRVPPLRERTEDIPEIFQRYFLEYARKYQRPNLKVDADVLEALRHRPWPGNVRELRNYAERLALLAPEGEITTKTLPDLGATPESSSDDLFAIDNFETFKNAAEKAYIERKLAESGWNIKQTAEKLGMQRSNLYKKIERYALRGPE
jgi:DNA-binding NtrC family response regulator